MPPVLGILVDVVSHLSHNKSIAAETSGSMHEQVHAIIKAQTPPAKFQV